MKGKENPKRAKGIGADRTKIGGVEEQKMEGA